MSGQSRDAEGHRPYFSVTNGSQPEPWFLVPAKWGTRCRRDDGRVFATATGRWWPFDVHLGHREEAAVDGVGKPNQ